MFSERKKIPSRVKEKALAEANAAVPRLNPAEVRQMIVKTNVAYPRCLGCSAAHFWLTGNRPIWIRGQEKVKPRRATSVGEHNGEVLRSAGYTDSEIHALRAAGVVA
jgi:crotonobetainyl-CoA:carnitine CoA-transferase CaiB-like acyl-CoA transferase